MSRCFPFPPPGYEKIPPADQIDLLIKGVGEVLAWEDGLLTQSYVFQFTASQTSQKHKEKHKKEKREKEKREGEERKDTDKKKDRSKDKHREKKDRKENHKDKEKRKDKDKEEKKDKDRIKDEKKILYNRKDSHTEGQNDGKSGESHQAADLKNAKFIEELGGRIRYERRAGDQMGANDTSKVQRKSQGMGISTEKERSTGKEIGHSINIPEQKRMGIASAMEERGAGNKMDQNSASAEQRRLDRMGRPMDKDANKETEKKEKAKEQKIDGRKEDKHKNENGEKKHKGKDKARNKEKEKEEKIREKGEQKHKEKDKLRDDLKRGQIGSRNVRPSFPPNDNAKSAAADGCPKRKEANGFLHENEVRPNKLLRASSSSQFSLENGNKSEQGHTSGLCTLVEDVALNMVKVEKNLDNKEHKINGVITIHSPLNMRRPPLIADATKNGGTSKKSPHPDEKCLSQILRLPKMEEEWPGFDAQEWLLIKDDLWQKPETRLESDETPKVWAEAVRIELEDILALPYVVPY